MTPLPENENPYPGPRPFEQHEQKLFFGRERPIRDLFSLTVAHRVLLIYAQSGAGKTSLLNAGLIPLLKEKRFRDLPVARVGGMIPREVNPENIPNVFVFNALMSWTQSHADPKSLAAGTIADFLRAEVAQAPEAERLTPRVAIFDQFEELFEVYSERWAEREGFFRQVADALDADPLLRVIFVIREDYLARLDPYADLLPERLRTRFRLERLRAEEAQQAIEKPLEGTPRSFAPDASKQLIEELLEIHVESAAGEKVKATGEFVEPVQLQVVCQNLWRDLPPDTTEITLAHLQKFGDVDEALGDFYARGVSAAVRDAAVKEPVVRAWFEQHLITAAGTRGTVYRGREQTGGLVNTAVDVLENQHLIRPELRAGSRWYELTHDRFIDPIRESNRTWHQHVQAAKSRRLAMLLTSGLAAVLCIALCVASALVISWNGSAENKVNNAVSTASVAETRVNVADQVRDLVAKGGAAVTDGKSDEAIAYYTKAIELDPGYSPGYINRGLVYYAQKQYDPAIADYNKAIELDPKYTIAYNNRGLVYYAQKQYDLAIADYNKAIELDPKYATAYNNRGLVYYAQKQYDLAIADYNKAVELDPKFATAYSNRGLVYYAQKQYALAIADHNKAIELDPKHATAYGNRGLVYYAQKQYDLAIADYNKAIELDPKYAIAYSNRGTAYGIEGDFENAIADKTKAIQLDPTNGPFYTSRCYFYNKTSNYDQAIADCNRAIELDPKDAYAYNNRGFAYYNKGNLDQALAGYNIAIELDPTDALAYNYRGLYYYNKGNVDQAIADYTKAIELDPKFELAPEDSEAYRGRGLAYRQKGLKTLATADFEMYLQVAPNASDRSQVERWIRELKAP